MGLCFVVGSHPHFLYTFVCAFDYCRCGLRMRFTGYNMGLQFVSVKSLRRDLNIPESALVVCRHGGASTFDNKAAHHAVRKKE